VGQFLQQWEVTTMRKKVVVVLAVLAILVVAVAPVGAITDGEPDNNRHPYVGLMVAFDDDGNRLWRCSGTLVSPTVFLTAGHCTRRPAPRSGSPRTSMLGCPGTTIPPPAR
jgi:V8-like Glu-specific endopeptidase